MPDLTVSFADIKFKNPYILASAPPTMDADHIIKASKFGWGGAVTKTMGIEKIQDVRPRLAPVRAGKITIGMTNIELISTKNVEQWCNKEIPKIKENVPDDFVLIGSIMASAEPKEWTTLAKRVEEVGVDMIELNISCPHGMPEKRMGMFIGQDAKLTERVTRAAKRNVKIPVIVKLTPNVTDIGLIANAAEKGGANALSAINTVTSIPGVDIEEEIPLPTVNRKSAPAGGLSGNCIKPIALRCITEIRKCSKLPLSGIGGISDWKTSVEFILLGASTLQVCTAVMFHGFKIIDVMKKGLLNYMAQKKYEYISDFCGNALKNITQHSKLKRSQRVRAEIIEERCTGCGLCLTACESGGFNAITIEHDVAKVDVKACDGCGLCKIMCNLEAIRFVE